MRALNKVLHKLIRWSTHWRPTNITLFDHLFFGRRDRKRFYGSVLTGLDSQCPTMLKCCKHLAFVSIGREFFLSRFKHDYSNLFVWYSIHTLIVDKCVSIDIHPPRKLFRSIGNVVQFFYMNTSMYDIFKSFTKNIECNKGIKSYTMQFIWEYGVRRYYKGGMFNATDSK
jgi:hypothetical protein